MTFQSAIEPLTFVGCGRYPVVVVTFADFVCAGDKFFKKTSGRIGTEKGDITSNTSKYETFLFHHTPDGYLH